MKVILDEVMNNISSHYISFLFEVSLHLNMCKSNIAPSGNTFLKGSNFDHVESLILIKSPGKDSANFKADRPSCKIW